MSVCHQCQHPQASHAAVSRGTEVERHEAMQQSLHSGKWKRMPWPSSSSCITVTRHSFTCNRLLHRQLSGPPLFPFSSNLSVQILTISISLSFLIFALKFDSFWTLVLHPLIVGLASTVETALLLGRLSLSVPEDKLISQLQL